jgi:SAM-dependent methyltransferase
MNNPVNETAASTEPAPATVEYTATPKPAETQTDPYDPYWCGLEDMVQSGWFLQGSNEILSGFRIERDDIVLDVGCGNGAATLFAANRGAHIIFSDVNPARVEELAQRIAQTPAQSYKAVVCDSNPIPLPDACATKVLAMEMLEHVDDPVAVLKELYRMGRPGALYLITVPDPVGEELQKEFAPATYFEKPNHIHIFQRDEFARLVTEAGLVIEHRHSSGFFWTIWMCLFWACEQDMAPPWHPLLENWTKTWITLLGMPQGSRIKKVLDEFMPKSQAIIARKPAL